MKAIIIKLVAVSVLLALLGAVILAGCANPAASVPTPAPTPPTTTGGTTPPPPAGATPTPPSGEPTPPPSTAPWQWPDRLHVAAIGTSGVPKLASFLSIMEQDTGMTIRIIPEASPARQGQLIRDGEMFLGLVDKTLPPVTAAPIPSACSGYQTSPIPVYSCAEIRTSRPFMTLARAPASRSGT